MSDSLKQADEIIKYEIEDFLAHEVNRSIHRTKGIVLPSQIPIYHGSPNKKVTPLYGFGKDKHDYGRGFYTTLDYELACEWAICTSEGENGYVHKYILDTSDLSVLNFNEVYGVLTWLATLSKHRSAVANSSKKAKIMEQKLIQKYYDPEIEDYDIIIGYRADDSFFSFAKQAIKGEVDISLLDEIMHKGELGYQVFLQSQKAFNRIKEIDMCPDGYFREVDYNKYVELYKQRDEAARDYVPKIIASDRNTLSDTIEKYL